MSGRLHVTPAARLTRGLLVAVLSTFLAGASHAIAGGGVPLLPAILAVVLGTLVCVLLAGHQLTLPRATLGVAASQVLFHSLFSVFSGATVSSTVVSGGHAHGTVPQLAVPVALSPAHDQLGLFMLATHLTAGLLTILAVKYGESIWWALVGVLSASLAALICTVDSAASASLPVMPAGAPIHGLNQLVLADARQHLRGPPVVGLTVA